MASINLPPSSNCPSAVDDIIKMGTLKKGRKGKKRFFVLRQDSYAAPASLDCYESEKRFRQGVSAKLSIKLKDVFNLNKTVDAKMKYCVGVFSRDDSLKLGCDSEQDQEAWLHTLINVFMNTKSGTPEENLRQNFDYCWDVLIVKDKGLTEKHPSLSGCHRFCLNSCSIYLYKKATDDPCIEFPLVYIPNYGHKNDTLYLRVGRSAVTGSGELWMETDDPVVAQHIHETMKNILDENHELRNSQRNTTQRNPPPNETRRQSGVAWSSSRTNSTVSGSGISLNANSTNSADRSQQPSSRARAISESEKTLASSLSVAGQVISGPRKVSAPVPFGFRRFRTESESSNEGSTADNVSARKLTSPNLMETRRKISSASLRGHLSHLQHRTPVGISSETLSVGGTTPVGPLPSVSAGYSSSTTPRSASHSPSAFHMPMQQWVPPGQSPLTTSPGNLSSTDSVASVSTAGDHDGNIRFSHWQSMAERAVSLEYVASQPTIVEEGSGSGAEYLPMQPPTNARTISYPTTRYRGLLTTDSIDISDAGTSYVDMNMADKDRRMTADSGYMEMASPMRAASSVTTCELPSSSSSDQVASDGYTPMGPSSYGRSTGNHSRQTSWHLEEVRSYISDSDSTCSSNVPPSRAYSLGSKPTTVGMSGLIIPSTSACPSSYLNKLVLSLADDRKRAHSVGSWNKSEMKPSTSLVVPHHFDKSSSIRQRSESFGSGRSTPGSRRFTDSSKCSKQSEDLVEMDFGTGGVGRSASGSLGSSDSLTRSRTGSLGNGGTATAASANKSTFWSPKVELINENDSSLLQRPSAKFIQQRILMENSKLLNPATAKEPSDYTLMGLTSSRGNNDHHDVTPTSGGGDYVSMDTTTSGGGDYVSMDTTTNGSKTTGNDYVIMNTRQKSAALTVSTTTPRQEAFRLGQDLETSSGYSSTGDCSTVADNGGASGTQKMTASTAGFPNNNSSPKILIGVQPSYRFHDVHGEDELMRRLARVEMSSPKHSPPAAAAAETYVNLTLGAPGVNEAEAVYENMNLNTNQPSSGGGGIHASSNRLAAANLTVSESTATVSPIKRSNSLNDRQGGVVPYPTAPVGHQRKFSENKPALLVIVPGDQQAASKSSKQQPSKSPILKVFSSFGKGQVKVGKPSSVQGTSAAAGLNVTSSSAAKDDSNSPAMSPLPHRLKTSPPTVSTTMVAPPLPAIAGANIEYAALELNAQTRTTSCSPKVSASSGGGGASPAAAVVPQIFASDEKDDATNVLYAQIDVAKSEGLKKAVRQC